MEQIKIVRLKNGEDIIGYVSESEYKCHIRDALVIQLHDDIRHQKQTLVLASWAPSSIIKVNECILYESDILTKFDPTEEFVDHYMGTLIAMTNVAKAKEEADKLSDNELIEMIEALRESQQTTVH